jgi:chromate reductase, NAD(P)H dehydrogenase (quinone)
MNILTIHGSLRRDSINKALALTAQRHAHGEMHIELMGIDGLPLFNQDDEETNYPARAEEAKEKISITDGVLIVTPEYNRAPPGSLKNFLDWTSRPAGKHPWSGKPVGVLGASDGLRGASFAQYDIRRIMGYFNARVMGQPEYYLSQGDTKIENGVVTDSKSIEVLVRFLQAFKTHVENAR